MKKNLPITAQEKNVPDGATLVSRTDTKGIITFANDAFVEVSGFTREELIGSSHNVVRHPDVPPAIFEDMWATLKKGLPWRGLVKNRCKNGDYYWVDAQVVPVRKNGAVIGYMSVRSKPSREAIAQAEAAYRAAQRSGSVVRQDGQRGWKRFLSVKNGVTLGIVFVTLMMIAGGILGITGLTLSSSAMRGLYYEQMAPVQTIGRINFLMADNRAQVVLALRQERGTQDAATLRQYMAQLSRNRQEIDALWAVYSKLPRNGVERELADYYWSARDRYVKAGLLPAQQALEQGDLARAHELLETSVNPLYGEANRRAEALLAFLSQKAQGNFSAVAERNETICIVAVIGISAGCLILLFAGVWFFRATVLPLEAAVVALERIGEGNLSDDSAATGYGEPGRVMAGVAMMRLHLKVMMNEIRQSSGSIREQCRRLNQVMMNLAQHSEEQHDRVYQTLDSANAASDGLAKLAHDAEQLLQLTESAQQEPVQPAENGRELAQIAHELAAAARLQAFAMDDTVEQMNQVASLIVDNRGDVQDAWAASQRLEQTAGELDKLVKYFD